MEEGLQHVQHPIGFSRVDLRLIMIDANGYLLVRMSQEGLAL